MIIRAEARCCMSTVVQLHTCIHNVTVHLTYACQSRNPNAFACNYAGSQGTQGNPLFMPVLDCTDMIEQLLLMAVLFSSEVEQLLQKKRVNGSKVQTILLFRGTLNVPKSLT